MIIFMNKHMKERQAKRLRERLTDAYARYSGVEHLFCQFCPNPLTEAERTLGLASCCECEDVELVA